MSTMKRSYKRPFQPSISSYFARSLHDPETIHTPPSSFLSPTLPATIQSNLLNVGMRVRKSVPEGYKTRPKTFCAPATPSWDTSSDNNTNPTGSQYGRNASTAAFTGLVPYCGTMKVGAHTMQSSVPAAEEDIPPLQFDHEDWDLFKPISASTLNASTNLVDRTTRYSSSNKRRREDADSEDLDVEAQPVSPRSRPVSHTRMPNLDQLRAIAVPKSRRKVVFNDGFREQEMVDAGDFGEAGFFRPDAWGGGFDGRRVNWG